jgi:hypothetical protein
MSDAYPTVARSRLEAVERELTAAEAKLAKVQKDAGAELERLQSKLDAKATALCTANDRYDTVVAERDAALSRLDAIKLAAETGEGSSQLTHTKAALRRILEILSRGVERRDGK